MPNPLFDAIWTSDVDRLAKLLAAGEDPNPLVENGCSYDLLYSAVNEPHPVATYSEGIDAIVLLLRYGAKVDPPNPEYPVTSLMLAAQNHHAECARLLLSAGANPNVKDDEGDSPLRLFTIAEDVAMVRLLLQCGADMYHSGGMDGMNSISLAARRLNIDLVRLFLAHGADPMVPDNDGQTVLDNMCDFPSISEPETPEKLARFHEIRRLLGAPEP
jgi:uncharacterized protein